MEKFGERLKFAMKKRKMTLGMIQIATGIDRASIKRYTDGKVIPRVDTAAKLARALHVSLDWLTGMNTK